MRHQHFRRRSRSSSQDSSVSWDSQASSWHTWWSEDRGTWWSEGSGTKGPPSGHRWNTQDEPAASARRATPKRNPANHEFSVARQHLLATVPEELRDAAAGLILIPQVENFKDPDVNKAKVEFYLEQHRGRIPEPTGNASVRRCRRRLYAEVCLGHRTIKSVNKHPRVRKNSKLTVDDAGESKWATRHPPGDPRRSPSPSSEGEAHTEDSSSDADKNTPVLAVTARPKVPAASSGSGTGGSGSQGPPPSPPDSQDPRTKQEWEQETAAERVDADRERRSASFSKDKIKAERHTDLAQTTDRVLGQKVKAEQVESSNPRSDTGKCSKEETVDTSPPTKQARSVPRRGKGVWADKLEAEQSARGSSGSEGPLPASSNSPRENPFSHFLRTDETVIKETERSYDSGRSCRWIERPIARTERIGLSLDINGVVNDRGGLPEHKALEHSWLPDHSFELCQYLVNAGFAIWLNTSFKGKNKVYAVESVRYQLAKELDFEPKVRYRTAAPEVFSPNEPTLFLKSISEPVGKAEECLKRNTVIHIDDRHDVCAWCEQYGVVAYQVRQPHYYRGGDTIVYYKEAKFSTICKTHPHRPRYGFTETVKALLDDHHSGRLSQKVRDCWHARTYTESGREIVHI